MILQLSGNELTALDTKEQLQDLILNSFINKAEHLKDVLDNSYKVYAYRFDAGVIGTSRIRFIVSNQEEEQILDSLWGDLGEHVEQYSYTWHVNYEAESSEDNDPYQEELDRHKESAPHYLELYSPKLHHMKIPGGSAKVKFELFY